jgi:polysaccharide export outer membrane protein
MPFFKRQLISILFIKLFFQAFNDSILRHYFIQMKLNYTILSPFLFFIGLNFCLMSCVVRKDMIYFQHADTTSLTRNVILDTLNYYTPILRPDDLISIQVCAMDPDVVRPFMLGGTVVTSSNNISTTNPPTYLIDAKGNIEFPVLGTLKLAGLSRNDAIVLIKERLKSYVSNPIVNMRILNFKITVLGEVKSPGVYTILNERVSLPEAIGLAGDLNITGIRKNVLVIREKDGKKIETRVDLTTRDAFKSPVFYLNQNDLVYVEPNKTRINASVNSLAYTTIGISSISLMMNVINFIRKK